MIASNHVHSMYSSLDGFSTPEEIAQRTADIGAQTCALTDHGVVTGHLHFAQAMEKQGLKPIFGAELYHGLKTTGFKGQERDQAHLIALAMTDQGLHNLWNLVHATSAANHFRYVGRVFWDDLKQYRDGVVFTSACALGLVPQGILRGDYEPLNRYLDILGDNFYIEISTYPAGHAFTDPESDDHYDMQLINEALYATALERGLPMTYGDDGHFAFPEQYEYHDIYLARQTKQTMYTPVDERKQWHPPDALVIKNEQLVRENLHYLPESVVDECIENAVAIAERADAHLPETKRHLPVFVPGDSPYLNQYLQKLSPEDLFIELVERGVVNRYGEDAGEEVWQRALYEVEALLTDNIHHYFLMGWDEIQMAKTLGIERGPGRGSSAGCLVAYALDITDVDPLHYDLLFERFWNPGRAKGFPDIDSDFSRARREEIIVGLKKRWGEDRVAAIGTTGYLKPKQTIDKLAPACGISREEAEELKNIVGQTTKIDILGHEQIGWNPELEPGKKHYVQIDVGPEIIKWIKSDRQRQDLREYFVKICETCCSRVAQYGVHASGIVISDQPIADELPCYRRGDKENGPEEEKGRPATMFAMDDVDNRMFVKLDVLGLRTLDVLEWWRAAMAEKHGIDVEWSGLDKKEHPQAMWDMLKQGFTAGIFQVEDGYGKQLCKAMEPSSILDMAALNALNRPGPIQAGTADHYVARKSGKEEITYPDPVFKQLVEPILAPTYGLFVYQEQIIGYFNALGYTLSESDAVRKIMGKKKPEQMDAVRDGLGEWEGRGYLDMATAAGISRTVAQEVWEGIEGFADYCFNKSHGVAYGIIGFRTLFAKYYAPAEFYAACIRSLDPSRDNKKRTEMLPQFINECRHQSIEVSPPDIRYSQGHPYVAENDTLYFGFSDVAGVKSSGPYVAQLRDDIGLDISTPWDFEKSFTNYNDTWVKLKKEKVKSGEWSPKVRSPKQLLQANKIQALIDVGCWGTGIGPEWTLTDQQEVEERLLGVILTDNNPEVMARNAERIATCDSYADLLTPFVEKAEAHEIDLDDDNAYIEYTVPGIVSHVQEKRAKASGKSFGIVRIEYEHDTVEFVIFNKNWKSHKFLFRIRTPGIFVLHHKAPSQYGESYSFVKGHILK